MATWLMNMVKVGSTRGHGRACFAAKMGFPRGKPDPRGHGFPGLVGKLVGIRGGRYAGPVKRRPPTAEELERARQAASEARVRAGLPAVDPGDLEWEQRQAERLRKRPKGKR